MSRSSSIFLGHGAAIESGQIGLYSGKPLHWAAKHAPRVSLLLLRGADPNARNLMKGNFEGFSPVHIYALLREKCVDCARQLLEADCDARAIDTRRAPF